jgi:hypothetical protein
MTRKPNPLLLVTPVYASLLFLSQLTGAPEQDRSATLNYLEQIASQAV